MKCECYYPHVIYKNSDLLKMDELILYIRIAKMSVSQSKKLMIELFAMFFCNIIKKVTEISALVFGEETKPHDLMTQNSEVKMS